LKRKGADIAVSGTPTREWTLWVVAVASLLHVAEEYLTGWREWARAALGIAVPAPRFLAANAALVAAAFLLARTGRRRPVASLVIPAATWVNAVFFHLLPTLVQGRVSPGLYTAVLLYLPFSSWAFWGAWRDGVPKRALLLGFALGTLLMGTVALAAREFGSLGAG
jgi:Protein of unknown function with HXXEE motif